MWLWCLSKIVLTTESPIPVPFPSSLVVKKGSNILPFMEGSIPVPLSETVIFMCFASWVLESCVGMFLGFGVVSLVMVMVPLFVIASDALMHRFIRTWWIWDLSPGMVGMLSWVFIFIVISLRNVFDSIVWRSVIISFTFIELVVKYSLREEFSSCLVRIFPRRDDNSMRCVYS